MADPERRDGEAPLERPHPDRSPFTISDTGADVAPAHRSVVGLAGDDTAPAPDEANRPARDLVGDTVGRYRVTARLGAGGMGVVYAAHDPALDRRVALKVLPALDDDRRAHLEQRLRREAQALARLDHEHVIAVYDVGVAAHSVFVAMQLVDGTTLDLHLAEVRPPPRRILELFVASGRGLAAAHDGGIVHRDFKPSNVLVDRAGRVYVGDFGLARTVGDDPDDTAAPATSLFHEQMTRHGAVMGTPLYMSPEQHRGEPATARSDQFSFCVSLWLALFGSNPFVAGRWTAAAASEAMARDEVRDPPRVRGVAPRVTRALRRGLRHDPQARWPSMAALCGELAPRSRTTWLLPGLTVGGIVGGVAIASLLGGGDRADPCGGAAAKIDTVWNPGARDRISRGFAATGLAYAADTTPRVLGALDRHAATWSAMRIDACRANRLRGEQSDDLLDRRMRCLDERLAALDGLIGAFAAADGDVLAGAIQAASRLTVDRCGDVDALLERAPAPDDPGVRAEVDAIATEAARAHASLDAGRIAGLADQADALVDRARQTGWQPVIAQAMHLAGTVLSEAAEYGRAAPILRDAAVAAARARDDHLATRALDGLARALAGHGNPSEALVVSTDAELLSARAGDHHALVADLAATRGYILHLLSRFSDARTAYGRSIAVIEQHRGADHVDLVPVLTNYGNMLHAAGELGLAAQALDRALAIAAARLGADHPTVGAVHGARSQVHLEAGEIDLAVASAEQAVSITRRALPPGHPRIATQLRRLGNALFIAERFAEAEPHLEEALALLRTAFGPDHADTIAAMYSLASLRRWQDRPDDAIALHREVLAHRLATLGPDHASVANSHDAVGRSLMDKHDAAAARPHLEAALAIRRRLLDPGSTDLASSLIVIARIDHALGECARALPAVEEALAILDRSAVTNPRLKATGLMPYYACLQATGRWAESRRPLEELAALVDQGGPMEIGYVQLERAKLDWRLGDRAAAAAHARAAAATYEAAGAAAELAEVQRWLREHVDRPRRR
jgi:eukaryotic-like serine/threonine-protein kinase